MDDRRYTAVETRRDTSSALPFAEQREQVRRFIGELSESTAAAEAEISGIVKQLLDGVASQRAGSGSKELAARESQLASREAQLSAREAQVNEQSKRLEAERAAWEATAAQGLQRDAASDGALEAIRTERKQLADERKQLADERARLDHESEDFARGRARLEERLQRQERAEEELEAEKRRTKSRRRKMLAELGEKQELAATEFKRRESELQLRAESLAAQERKLSESSTADTSALENEVRRLQRELDEYVDGFERYRRENVELRERLEQSAEAGSDDAAYDTLRSRFDETQAELRDLQRRYLELERSHEATAASPSAAGGGLAMDWESQKRRLLASLEADTDASNPKSRSDRLTVEGAIRITDGVVQEKEREIAELKRILEQQSCNMGEVSIGAAALAGMLDQDDLIREHREQAETLKRQWEEKLRAAEIEISIERAKLGRERNELIEKKADLEAQLARTGTGADVPVVNIHADDPKRTGGGRWLARLGLRDRENG